MKELYLKVLNWYKGLKTWKKVVGFAVLILIALLGVVYLVYQIMDRPPPVVPKPVDDAHNTVVNNVVETSKANQRKLEAELMIKKVDAQQEAAKRVKSADKQKEIRKQISNAQSFEEVDAILKGMKR
jgi:hypothetical protein